MKLEPILKLVAVALFVLTAILVFADVKYQVHMGFLVLALAAWAGSK